MSRFDFLRKEWFDLYNIILSAEKMIDEDSNVSLIKLRQVVELVTENILMLNNIQKGVDLADSINLLKSCEDIDKDTTDLFNKIRSVGNKAAHKTYSDSRIAKSFIDRIFGELVWFAIQYGNEDYSQIDLTEMSNESKIIFYEKLMKKQFENDKNKISYINNNMQNEILVAPLKISNDQIFKNDCHSNYKNKYERDIFETSEEFYQRIKNVETVNLGSIFIELTQNNQTEDIAIFAFSILKGLTIKTPDIDLLYIDKRELERASVRQEKYKLISQLDIVEGNVCVDVKNIFIVEDNKKCKVNAVVLDAFWFKEELDYKDNISSLGVVPLGIVRINKHLYDLDKEVMPITIDYYEWLNILDFGKSGIIEIDRKEAKLLCEENLYHVLVGKLDVFDNGIIIKGCYIKSKMLDKNIDINIDSQNIKQKLYYYINEAYKDDRDAMNSIGDIYFNGDGVDKDLNKAFAWYKKAAEKGNVAAMNSLADMYYDGIGGEKSYKEAFRWYKKAAKKENLDSMNSLGNMYYYGEHVEKDYKEALRWIKNSIEKGNVEAMAFLGCYYIEGKAVGQDYKEAFIWLNKAAEKGNAEAMYLIANMYEGGMGVDINIKEAIKWEKQAAEKGFEGSMNNLGSRYLIGRGVDIDYKEAMKWYKRAAEKGNAEAMAFIGFIYEEGKGVDVDYKEALRWYKQAAEEGCVNALVSIGDIYCSGQGVDIDHKEAVKMYKEAADKGDAEGMRKIGIMYLKGQGVNTDTDEALKWFEKGEESGDDVCKEVIAKIEANLN